MSPYEAVSARLGERLTALPQRAQVLFFAGATQVLLPAYARWLQLGSHGQERLELLEDAIGVARAYATTGLASADLDRLIAAMERDAPEENPLEGFTAAQDAWISGDVALRVARGDFDPGAGMWYVLEPQFQATSERLFGVSDVGSENEAEGEAAALEDPVLARAVAAIERALDRLAGRSEPTDEDAGAVTDALKPLFA